MTKLDRFRGHCTISSHRAGPFWPLASRRARVRGKEAPPMSLISAAAAMHASTEWRPSMVTLYRVTGVIDCDLHWWSTGWCAWRGGSLAHARRASHQFRLTVRALRGFGDFGLRILVPCGPQGDPSNTDCGIVSFWLSVSGCDGRCRRQFTRGQQRRQIECRRVQGAMLMSSARFAGNCAGPQATRVGGGAKPIDQQSRRRSVQP